MIEIASSIISVLAGLPASLLVFLIMFLAAAFLPIPSETIIMILGTKINLPTLLIYGSAGATLGSLVMYALGRKLGKFVKKYPHMFLVNRKTLERIEKFIKKHEKNAILLGRAIPLVPHKVISMIAGSFKINLKDFIVFGFIGMIIRLLIFSYSGKILSLNITIGAIIVTIILGVSYAIRKKLKIHH